MLELSHLKKVFADCKLFEYKQIADRKTVELLIFAKLQNTSMLFILQSC